MASITSATSGRSNITGTWTGGVVPVSGDQVIVDHPGTNILGTSTLYALNGSRSAGDTVIPVTGGAGTIVAGECIQIEHAIGADEDGNIVFDPTYYKVTTGITGAGSLVITPGLAYSMASGLPVINRGHVVEVAGNHVWGHDISSATVASNSIVIKGTLKWSRFTGTTLTLRGSCVAANGGTVDAGYPGSEAITAVSHTIEVNDSAVPTAGKHAFVAQLQSTGVTWRTCGIARTRNTRLTNAISAGATSITVDASSNWSIGDSIVIASDNDDPLRAQIVVISGGSSPTWTVPAITNARAVGCRVGNLTSNITIKSKSASATGVCGVQILNTDTTGRVNIQDVTFLDIGNSSGWTGISTIAMLQRSFGLESASARTCSVRRAAFYGTTSTAMAGIAPSAAALNRQQVKDFAIYCPSSTDAALFLPQGSMADIDGVVYRASSQAISSANGDGSVSAEISGEYWSATNLLRFSPAVGMKITGAILHSPVGLIVGGNSTTGSVLLDGCTISAPRIVAAISASVAYQATLANCTYSSSALSGTNTTAAAPSKASAIKLISVNGSASDNRVKSYWQDTVTDTVIRNRGTYSVKIQPRVSNTSIPYTFLIPAVAGVAQTIKGSLRFDATYGIATPPVIALSGQGVTASHTCAAVADAWDDFVLSITPTSTGDITATVAVQSASTAGFAWLDGVYHYHMVQTVNRHWGYQWLPQAAQLVDTRITLTEAAALALPVVVDHTAQTVTVTGVLSPSEALQAQLVDLVQTANNAHAVHVTGDGSTFATTYTVVFSGSGAITGPYADATGLHVSITSSALDAGTLVQIWDAAAATELYIGTPSGSLSLPIVYPGTDKTLRLRAMQCGVASASLFVEQLGVLTSAGASFLVTQSPDSVYAANAIDGSAVTGITIDDTLMRFVLSGRTSISWAEIYAYEAWWLSTVDGMRDDGRIIAAIDPANYVLTGFQLRNDNPGGAPITLTGGWGRDSVTGQTITLIDTTGGPIFAAPDAVIAHGQSAATPAEIWSHASRTLTADPGAAGHAATQAAIAAVQSVAQAARDQAALAVALSA